MQIENNLNDSILNFEMNVECRNEPIRRKMHYIHLKVKSDKYDNLCEYMKKYCNKVIYTRKKIPRIHGCGANHGVCKLCKPIRDIRKKENKWKKSYDMDN